uniref:DNA topoisomerase n=1 Tax=viral metagenome TaxID=1070528 RepID=A0A6C0JLD4_9ZZZZ
MPPKFYKRSSNKPKTEKVSQNLSTAKYLIIVESPSKCAKIESYLGDKYCCIASKGHIRTIDGLKSIDTKKTYEPTFSIIDEKKVHVETMREIISNFSKDNIILASDDDREGEAIAWHICQIFDLPVETTKRIIFHEVTKPAIQKAIETPTIINMDLVHAQHARQVLDILVGYRISPYLWKYLYSNKSNSLSAGRCQTPALRLVYDNEKQRENNSIETKYKTIGIFTQKRIPFELNHEFDKEEEVLVFLEKTKNHDHKISLGSPKDAIKSAPKPFHTSRLLQVASNVLHVSPKETMSLCQTLYQSGYITYMRTESSQYSKIFLDQADKFITKEWNLNFIGDFEKLANKDASNPHEAIRVTNLETRSITNGEDSRLASMYRLIWRNTLESCMADAKYNTIKVEISAPLDYKYQYTIEIPIFLGWKIVFDKSDNETQTQNEGSGMQLYVQSIAKSDKPILYQNIDSTVVVRNKHQHYTEASLINKLEDLGIGRPSTFASIVDTIIERGYVKKTNLEGTITKCSEFKLTEKVIEKTIKEKTFGNEKNKLVIQPTGVLTIEFLIQNFENLFSYNYTKNMEEQLDLVSSGKEQKWSSICGDCDKEIKDLAKVIKNLSKQTYFLNDTHEIVFQAYGASIKHTLENGTIEYLPTKKDIKIDLEKLKNGGYTIDDLIEIKNNHLGKYEEENLFIKNGRYGPYVEWGSKRESIKDINKPLNEITFDDIISYLSKEDGKQERNVLRVLNGNLSVRKGKFGAYVYYKRKDMAKPEFLNIKKFNEGFLTCDAETLINWVCEKYKIY